MGHKISCCEQIKKMNAKKISCSPLIRMNKSQKENVTCTLHNKQNEYKENIVCIVNRMNGRRQFCTSRKEQVC